MSVTRPKYPHRTAECNRKIYGVGKRRRISLEKKKQDCLAEIADELLLINHYSSLTDVVLQRR